MTLQSLEDSPLKAVSVSLGHCRQEMNWKLKAGTLQAKLLCSLGGQSIHTETQVRQWGLRREWHHRPPCLSRWVRLHLRKQNKSDQKGLYRINAELETFINSSRNLACVVHDSAQGVTASQSLAARHCSTYFNPSTPGGRGRGRICEFKASSGQPELCRETLSQKNK